MVQFFGQKFHSGGCACLSNHPKMTLDMQFGRGKCSSGRQAPSRLIIPYFHFTILNNIKSSGLERHYIKYLLILSKRTRNFDHDHCVVKTECDCRGLPCVFGHDGPFPMQMSG